MAKRAPNTALLEALIYRPAGSYLLTDLGDFLRTC